MAAAASRCQFWLHNKRRFCANSPLPSSQFCGNHHPSTAARRVPCPLDSSHSVLEDNLESHKKRCPFRKRAEALETEPYYSKSINAGASDGSNDDFVSSLAKRSAIYKLSAPQFHNLIDKIKYVHSAVSGELRDSYVALETCEKWLQWHLDRKLPFQEKHVVQQASILGNMEAFGILQKRNEGTLDKGREECEEVGNLDEEDDRGLAVVEFGAGRGYLTQMLADCYRISRVFLVERRSYKLKADRSLRQNQRIMLERLRIDIEDLNMHGVKSLRGLPYLATGKHICGPATDLTIRCCLHEQYNQGDGTSPSSCNLQGLALAICCHHLCQWKHYANKKFFSDLGITKEEFHAMTWFSSWAVDGDHSSKFESIEGEEMHLESRETKDFDLQGGGIQKTVRSISPGDRAALGFMCKEILDVGRMLWLRDNGLDAQLVYYVPSRISPENHLLVAKFRT